MKKVLLMVAAFVMAFGFSKVAMASALLDSQQGDARLYDDVDLIFMGYANLIVDHKDTLDFRLLPGGFAGSGNNEWGGMVDGKHEGIGVIGAYINRPWTPYLGAGASNANNGTWTPTGGANWNADLSTLSTLTNFTAPALPGLVTGTVTPQNKVDLFWGKSSDNGNIGIALNYGDNQSTPANSLIKTDDPTADPNSENLSNWARVLGLNVGLGFKDAGPFNQLNIHAGYSYGTFEDSLVTGNTNQGGTVAKLSTKDDGIYAITLGALAQNDMDKDNSMRYFADVALNQLNTKGSYTVDTTGDGLHNAAGDLDTQLSTKDSGLALSLGMGCVHKVNDGAAVVRSGLIAKLNTTTVKYAESTQNGNTATVTNNLLGTSEADETDFAVLWEAGVDSRVASWLSVRGGMSENIFARNSLKTINPTSTTVTDTTTETGETSTAALTMPSFSFGFGINWQNWNLNANVDINTFENSLQHVAPGNGIFVSNSDIVTCTEVDLAYNY